MKKDDLLRRLDHEWRSFLAACDGLNEAEWTMPGVTGDWSVRDLVAHVTWWEEEALKHLPVILAGGRPPRYSVAYGGIDAFNAQMAERKMGLSLAEVLRERDETHRRLIAYLQTVPEEQFTGETRFRRRLKLDTYAHYPLHAETIRAWRARIEP